MRSDFEHYTKKLLSIMLTIVLLTFICLLLNNVLAQLQWNKIKQNLDGCLQTDTGKVIYVYVPHLFGNVPRLEATGSEWLGHTKIFLALWEPLVFRLNTFTATNNVDQNISNSDYFLNYQRDETASLDQIWYGPPIDNFKWGLYTYKGNDKYLSYAFSFVYNGPHSYPSSEAGNIFICAPADFSKLPIPTPDRLKVFTDNFYIEDEEGPKPVAIGP
jgi:hypothetical protein